MAANTQRYAASRCGPRSKFLRGARGEVDVRERLETLALEAVVVAATRVDFIHHGRHLRRDRGRIGPFGQAHVLVRCPIRRLLQVERKVELETRVGRRIGHDGAYRHGRGADGHGLADRVFAGSEVALRRGLRQDGRARVAKSLREGRARHALEREQIHEPRARRGDELAVGREAVAIFGFHVLLVVEDHVVGRLLHGGDDLHESPRERPLLGGIVRVVTEALEADVRVLAGAVLAQDAVDAIGAVVVRIPAELVLQEDGDERAADEPDGEAHGIYGRVAGTAAKRAERETNVGVEHGAWKVARRKTERCM
jgi:hypothetical protein